MTQRRAWRLALHPKRDSRIREIKSDRLLDTAHLLLPADQAGSPRRRARDAVSANRSRPSLPPFWHRPFSPPRLRTAAKAPYGEPPLVLRDQSAALRSSNP